MVLALSRTERAAMAGGTLAADDVTTVGFAMAGRGFAVIKYPVFLDAGGRLAAALDADVAELTDVIKFS